MNTNNEPEQRQADFYTSQRTREDGLNIYSTRDTDSSVYSPKTPYNERKQKSAKGVKGLSHKQNENIELALYKLGKEYGFDNCKWFVFTFDESTSDEALENILTNFRELDRAIKYVFNNVYKDLAVKPYLIVYGLRKRTSYDRNIPCFDVNVICAFTDKNSKQLFNEIALIREVYQRVSKQAKETIKIPSDYYNHAPYNGWEDYKRLANYLKNQVDSDLLKHFQNTKYSSQLPKTWVNIPDSLKKTFTDIKVNYVGSTAKEHRKLIEEKFDKRVTIVDRENVSYKCVTQLNLDESVEDFTSEYQQEYNSKYPDRIGNNQQSSISQQS